MIFHTAAISGEFLTWIALGFLVAVLVAAEVYIHLRGLRGTLVKIEADRPSCTGGGAGVNVRVRLAGGKIVDATANPCGLCAGKLCVGDRVTLVRNGSGYVLALPLVAKSR
ncbi:MAG: hypothetical protein ACYS8W_17040 [Planctomycetota bacterium]|jgi:hypothetical protein